MLKKLSISVGVSFVLASVILAIYLAISYVLRDKEGNKPERLIGLKDEDEFARIVYCGEPPIVRPDGVLVGKGLHRNDIHKILGKPNVEGEWLRHAEWKGFQTDRWSLLDYHRKPKHQFWLSNNGKLTWAVSITYDPVNLKAVRIEFYDR